MVPLIEVSKVGIYVLFILKRFQKCKENSFGMKWTF